MTPALAALAPLYELLAPGWRWLLGCFALAALVGCSALEYHANGCGTGRWRGWDAASACDRILSERHAKELARDRK